GVGVGAVQAELPQPVVLEPRLPRGVDDEYVGSALQEFRSLVQVQLRPTLPALGGRRDPHAVTADRPRIGHAGNVQVLWRAVGRGVGLPARPYRVQLAPQACHREIDGPDVLGALADIVARIDHPLLDVAALGTDAHGLEDAAPLIDEARA